MSGLPPHEIPLDELKQKILEAMGQHAKTYAPIPVTPEACITMRYEHPEWSQPISGTAASAVLYKLELVAPNTVRVTQYECEKADEPYTADLDHVLSPFLLQTRPRWSCVDLEPGYLMYRMRGVWEQYQGETMPDFRSPPSREGRTA